MLSGFCRRIFGSQTNEEKKDEEQGMPKEEEEQEIQNNSQYIDSLASEYQLNGSLNLPNQLNQRLEAIANREALENTLRTKINTGIFRVLCNPPPSDTTIPVKGLKNHPALAKFHGDKIELKAQERNNFGDSPLDRLILTRFPSLADKISIFHYLFVKGGSQLENSLKYILVVSYLADKPFYDHLECLLLDSNDLNGFFSQEYSFNPYLGRKDVLTEAVSHLLSIIAEKEVMREGGIQFMQQIIEKYMYSKVVDFKYVHENNKFTVLHPIFYLISKGMWKNLKEWIEIDPGLLLLSDEKGKTPLISTIVTFSHGLIAKGQCQGHDALTNLQEFSIECYLKLKIYDKLQPDHAIIEPQFALLLGYLECGKAQSTIDNENINANENDERFIKTTKFYYKSLIAHFIKKDLELSRNIFLKSTIDNQTLCYKARRISMYGLLLNHGYKLEISQNINIEDGRITVDKRQKDALSAQEKTIQLYKDIFEENKNVKKINQYAINILDELQLNILECSFAQDDLASFISLMFKDYLVLKYTDDDVKNTNESQQKMHSILLEMIKKLEFSSIPHIGCQQCTQIYPQTVSEKHMCLRLSHETFNQICLMTEIDLLGAISKKLSHVKIEPEESTQLMHLLLENSINAFWFSNKEKSDLESSKRFVKTAKILHDMIHQISLSANEKLVDLAIEKNDSYQESEEYFKVNIQDADTNISSALDIEFSLQEMKFVLRESSKNLKDYLHLYNFMVGMLSRLFLWSNITDAQLNLVDQESRKSSSFDSFFSFLSKKTQVSNSNLQNFRKAFKLALLVPEISVNKKDLGRFFQFLIKHKDKQFLQELNDLTNDLWKYIILSEDPKEPSLIPFILNQRNDNDYTFQVVRRLIKHRIIIKDIDGCLTWINYGLNSLKSKSKLNTTFNPNQGALIYYSLIQATGMANASIVEQILKSFPACLMGYDAITAEQIPSHELFSILRAHSKSKMIENQEFKQSVDKIAVLLLEYGYPIELIKKWKDKSFFDFVKSLAKDQLMYSAAGVAIDWVRNITPFPAGIVDFGKDIAKTALGSYFYVTIYNDSFDFIYGQLSSSSKIDIGEFCHVFSSIFQPEGFLDGLREISFLTGLNETPTIEKTRKNAQTVNVILTEMMGPKYKEEGSQTPTLKKLFVRTCNARNIDIETLNQPVIEMMEEEKSNKHSKQENRNFLLFRYKVSQPKEEIVVHQVNDFGRKLLSRIGAAVITGTFMFLNDELGVQRYVCAAVGLLPTVFSGLCSAASFASECLKGMLNIAGSLPVYTFLLPLIGGTIYVGYKIYKEHQANYSSEKKVMFDLRTIQKLVEKFQTNQNKVQIQEVFPNEEVYVFVKELFHSYNGDEFVPQQTFWDLMKRFGITETLKREVRSIKNREDNISFLEIVESLSLVATYLNAEKVRKFLDDFKINESPKSKLIHLLHMFIAGKVTNLRLEAHNQGIQYPVDKEFNVGARFIVFKDSYRHNLNDNVFYDLIIGISTKIIQEE